jgi:hypothetical protein
LHSSWTDAQKKASPGAASTEEWSKYAGRKVEAGFWVALAYVVLLRSELLATLLYDDLIHTASLYAALGLVAINVCIGVYLYVFVQFRQGITVRPGLPACLFFFFFFFKCSHSVPPQFSDWDTLGEPPSMVVCSCCAFLFLLLLLLLYIFNPIDCVYPSTPAGLEHPLPGSDLRGNVYRARAERVRHGRNLARVRLAEPGDPLCALSGLPQLLPLFAIVLRMGQKKKKKKK